MKNLILRNAKPEDAGTARELVYFAGQCFFNHTFGFGKEKEKALDFIEYAFAKEAGAFSYKFACITELKGDILGLELGYDGETKREQDSIVEKQIMTYYKVFQLVRLFRRGLHVKKFFKEVPEDAYYLASIAVFPKYRRKGIGNELMNCVFNKMNEKKLKKCMLDVSITKDSTIKFYEKYGFEIVGESRSPRLEKRYNLEGQYRMIYEV
jgi:ribosomal protein S18 acetylase RimI-like enzyme